MTYVQDHLARLRLAFMTCGCVQTKVNRCKHDRMLSTARRWMRKVSTVMTEEELTVQRLEAVVDRWKVKGKEL